jgi:hypothetical protein
MTRNKVLSCLAVFSAMTSGLYAAQAPAVAPAPSFTISASNVTMPSSGMVAIPFTLTSVNGFAGSVAVLCVEPTVVGSINRGPYCDQGGPLMAYTLVADGTTTGSVTIVAIKPNPVPLASKSSLIGHGRGASWALACALILGLGLKRKSVLRLSRIALAVFLLMGLAGFGICGCGGPPTLTPGTYPFMLNATSVSTNPSLYASTTATVTVPAGIVTSNGSN